jgi:hypothetical protein
VVIWRIDLMIYLMILPISSVSKSARAAFDHQIDHPIVREITRSPDQTIDHELATSPDQQIRPLQ